MEKHSIAPVLEHYGLQQQDETRMGWVKTKCPFHNDTHASAAVNYQANTFKCFACTMAGDTYKLIMEKEGIGFREAIAFAEAISGDSNATLSTVNRRGRAVPAKQGANNSRRSFKSPRGRRGSSARP